jgi:hypothetical protein
LVGVDVPLAEGDTETFFMPAIVARILSAALVLSPVLAGLAFCAGSKPAGRMNVRGASSCLIAVSFWRQLLSYVD